MAEQLKLEGQQFGNYRLERLLGSGGFAEVYLGWHARLHRKAAIKVLHAHLTEKEKHDFQREAQIIAALDHPHIIRILDFDVHNGMPFLVMDYLPNGTVRQRHVHGTRLALSTVISYIQQVADGLQYAHDQKLIHRDIKPENMLIGRRDEIVLSDFGIAAIAHSTSSMTVQDSMGTIPYMAPEQIQAQARAASDQYALGIVVYEWLCGNRPFTGTATEIIAKHLMASPPPLRKKLPQLPVEIERVILTALAKDPKERFESVQAFARALETASRTSQRPATTRVEKTVSPASSPSHSPLPPTTPPNSIRGEVSASKTPANQKPSISVPAVTPPVVKTPPVKKTHAHKTSRRNVVLGLASAGALTVGGGVTWWIISHPSHPFTSFSYVYTYRGHSNVVTGVAWSPDKKHIASSSYDTTVQVWNAADSSHTYTYHGHPDAVNAVAWSPNGHFLVPNEQLIASGSSDNTVQVWSATNNSPVYTYNGHSDAVNTIAWSPNGQNIASGSYDQTVKIWNLVDGNTPYTYTGHSDVVNTIAWSPDGTNIASGSKDKTVQVWNAVDGSQICTYNGHSDAVNAVAWSPNGQHIASGSDDQTVQIWNAIDGSPIYAYTGHSDAVNTVAWSPDGQCIASGSNDNTVQVWDATNGSLIYTCHGSSGAVNTVAWSPDEKYIAWGGDSHIVQVWKAR